MSYPNIAVQFDDFDEEYEVIRQKSRAVYQELAKFKDRTEAFAYATTKAAIEELGRVVDLTDDDQPE